MTRIYLDNCCFNRPYDNQDNIMIRMETDAKLFVQSLILKKQLELVWSFVLDYENNDNPFEERRNSICTWRPIAVIDCDLNEVITYKATNLMKLGLRHKDAAHVACAIYSNAEYFLTTDKKILNKPVNDICLLNPVDFVRRYLNDQ